MSLSLKATKDEIIVRKLNQLEKDFIREATMRLAVNEPDTKQVVQEAIELAMEIDRQCGPVFEKEKMFDKNYRDIN